MGAGSRGVGQGEGRGGKGPVLQNVQGKGAEGLMC